MIVYDTEIVKAIRHRSEPVLPDIEYCQGWTDFAGMEISVLCAYEYRTGRYRVFLEDKLPDCGVQLQAV